MRISLAQKLYLADDTELRDLSLIKIDNISSRAFINCTSITSLTSDDTLRKVGLEAFRNCTSLTTITLGESITELGERAFMGCSSITKLITDQTLRAIGKEAFRGCEKLTSIELGEGVSELGNSAFMGCMTLKSVKCHATVPPTLGDKYVFDYNAEGRKIYVPSEALDTYKSHEQWSRYADSIEALK